MHWEVVGAISEFIGAVVVVVTLMTEPGSHAFWEQHGKHGVHDDFRNAVDDALASGEKSYTMD